MQEANVTLISPFVGRILIGISAPLERIMNPPMIQVLHPSRQFMNITRNLITRPSLWARHSAILVKLKNFLELTFWPLVQLYWTNWVNPLSILNETLPHRKQKNRISKNRHDQRAFRPNDGWWSMATELLSEGIKSSIRILKNSFTGLRIKLLNNQTRDDCNAYGGYFHPYMRRSYLGTTNSLIKSPQQINIRVIKNLPNWNLWLAE